MRNPSAANLITAIWLSCLTAVRLIPICHPSSRRCKDCAPTPTFATCTPLTSINTTQQPFVIRRLFFFACTCLVASFRSLALAVSCVEECQLCLHFVILISKLCVSARGPEAEKDTLRRLHRLVDHDHWPAGKSTMCKQEDNMQD